MSRRPSKTIASSARAPSKPQFSAKPSATTASPATPPTASSSSKATKRPAAASATPAASAQHRLSPPSPSSPSHPSPAQHHQDSRTHLNFQPLSAKYQTRALECVAKSFTSQDPFTKALGLDENQWKHFAGLFLRRAAHRENSWSFVALDDSQKRIEGVILNEDWKEPLPSGYLGSDPVWRPVRALFRTLHIGYMAQRRIKPGLVLHPLYFTCVRPESRRQGITRELWKATLNVARDYNFQYIAAEASTRSVRDVLSKLGFEEKVSVPYEDFRFEGGRPFEAMHRANAPEFDRLSLFERRITSDLFV